MSIKEEDYTGRAKFRKVKARQRKRKTVKRSDTECYICLYNDICPKAYVRSKCSLVEFDKPDLSTAADIEAAQRKILSGAIETLERAEKLSSLGRISFSDLDRLRNHVFTFSEKFKRTISGSKKDSRSTSEKLGM